MGEFWGLYLTSGVLGSKSLARIIVVKSFGHIQNFLRIRKPRYQFGPFSPGHTDGQTESILIPPYPRIVSFLAFVREGGEVKSDF